MISGCNLKAERARMNLSINELSELIGFSSASISNWEKDISGISAGNLLILANFFNVSVDYLLNIKKEKAENESYEFNNSSLS